MGDIDFATVAEAFKRNDLKAIGEYADQLNELLITSIWHNKTETLDFILREAARVRELVESKVCFESLDYYCGFLWGIENVVENIIGYKREFTELDNKIRKHKTLSRILLYLKEQGTVQHKELADYLGKSVSTLSNFFSNNNIERLGIIDIDRVGKTTWYALTRLGEEYIEVMRERQEKDLATVNAFQNKQTSGMLSEDPDYIYLSKTKREELLSLSKNRSKEESVAYMEETAASRSAANKSQINSATQLSYRNSSRNSSSEKITAA